VDAANLFHGELGGFGLFNEHGVPQRNDHALRAGRARPARTSRGPECGGHRGRGAGQQFRTTRVGPPARGRQTSLVRSDSCGNSFGGCPPQFRVGRQLHQRLHQCPCTAAFGASRHRLDPAASGGQRSVARAPRLFTVQAASASELLSPGSGVGRFSGVAMRSPHPCPLPPGAGESSAGAGETDALDLLRSGSVDSLSLGRGQG